MNIAIIPARKGSQGVPGKNTKTLAGKPLIGYTIESAKRSNIFSDIFISTDSPEIIDIAQSYDISVPFLRPDELARGDTPMLDVVKHVVAYYREKGIKPEVITLLQPTCPFRTSADIIEAFGRFNANDFDSLISVKKVPDKYNPNWVFKEEEKGFLSLYSNNEQPISRRQDLPTTYIREGSIYMFKLQTLNIYNNIYGKKIAYHEVTRDTVNIDTPEDFLEAELLMNKSYK